jgi:hypothetical protein
MDGLDSAFRFCEHRSKSQLADSVTR